jgi:hypothetical protein
MKYTVWGNEYAKTCQANQCKMVPGVLCSKWPGRLHAVLLVVKSIQSPL